MLTVPMMLGGRNERGPVKVYADASVYHPDEYYTDLAGTKLLSANLGEDILLDLDWIDGEVPSSSVTPYSMSGHLLMENVKELAVNDPNLYVSLAKMTHLETYSNGLEELNTTAGGCVSDGNYRETDCVYSFPELTAIQCGSSTYPFIMRVGKTYTVLSTFDFHSLEEWDLTGGVLFLDCYGTMRFNFHKSVEFTSTRNVAMSHGSDVILDFHGEFINHPYNKRITSTSYHTYVILRQETVATYASFDDSVRLFFVPDSLVDSYKAATGWSSISSRIYGFSDFGEQVNDPRITLD